MKYAVNASIVANIFNCFYMIVFLYFGIY